MRESEEFKPDRNKSSKETLSNAEQKKGICVRERETDKLGEINASVCREKKRISENDSKRKRDGETTGETH